jgi:hypothetical protein
MDLVRDSVAQIRQLVQNSSKRNKNVAKWKQLAEADKHTLCKFLDRQALATGLFHMYVTTYKELNRAARNRDRKMLRKQNKTNIKERQKL